MLAFDNLKSFIVFLVIYCIIYLYFFYHPKGQRTMNYKEYRFLKKIQKLKKKYLQNKIAKRDIDLKLKSSDWSLLLKYFDQQGYFVDIFLDKPLDATTLDLETIEISDFGIYALEKYRRSLLVKIFLWIVVTIIAAIVGVVIEVFLGGWLIGL